MGLVHLYIDDSGTRQPDRKPDIQRRDEVDCFALGGILLGSDQIGTLIGRHREFCQRWDLKRPLHSTKIRGKRDAFSWMGKDQDLANAFLSELEGLILSLPVIGIACVVDRPGYMERYAPAYEKPWLLCKTAYAILIERAAKYARSRDSQLAIYFEEAGKVEDRDILNYTKLLRSDGMPFDAARSADYEGLYPSDFKEILAGEPNRVTKSVPMIQFADLVLYPIVKAGYDANYGPYKRLMEAGRIIDALIPQEACASSGVKYSCFDKKRKGPDRSEP